MLVTGLLSHQVKAGLWSWKTEKVFVSKMESVHFHVTKWVAPDIRSNGLLTSSGCIIKVTHWKCILLKLDGIELMLRSLLVCLCRF